MKINYCCDPSRIVDADKRDYSIASMKAAGIDTVWLFGYFYGRMASDLDKMVRAREILESEGFEVGAISLPVGHPGNAMNPEIDEVDLRIPDRWRYRVDRHGEKVYFCADIEPVMIADNAESVRIMKDAGFTRFFMDDDTRMGNYGPEIQGCFCDDCIADFNKKYSVKINREELSRLIETPAPGSDILMKWTEFNCGKVDDLMQAMAAEGAELGIMVMNSGDERHGIDIETLKRKVPGCMFRVGEAYFDDKSFGSPRGKIRDYMSIVGHLNRTGRDKSYSETTGYPPHTLSPINYVYKAKMALTAGVQNIFYMSGFWFIDEEYWNALAAGLPELRALAHETEKYDRVYPIHIAAGTHGSFGEGLQPVHSPMLAGLPVKPVRSGDAIGTPDGILLFFGQYALTTEWEKKFSEYGTVIFDTAAAEMHGSALKAHKNIIVWPHRAGGAPAAEEAGMLRGLISGLRPNFPYVSEGSNIVLTWLAERGSVILFNLEDNSCDCTVTYKGVDKKIGLAPLEFKIIDLEK